MRRSVVAVLVLLFSLNTFSQKVSIEVPTSDDQVQSNTSSGKIESSPVLPVNNSAAVVVASPVHQSEIREIDFEILKSFQAFDSFEKVIQKFPNLVCKNQYTNPLDLKCYECSYSQNDSIWKISFHRKEVGDEGCDLAGVSKTIYSSANFAKEKKAFINVIEDQYKVSFEKAGEKQIAGSSEEDFQVFTTKIFSTTKNKFEEVLVAQVRFIHSLANQSRIKNAIDTMSSAFSSLPKKAYENFVVEFFPDDSSDLSLQNAATILKLKTDKVKNDSDKESSTLAIEKGQKQESRRDIYLPLLKSLNFHRNNEDYKNYHLCYENLMKEILPLEVTKEDIEDFKTSEYFSISGLEEEKVILKENIKEEIKKIEEETESEKVDRPIVISWNKEFESSEDENTYCKAFDYLREEMLKTEVEPLTCDVLGGKFDSQENLYKKFFKGSDDSGFKIYRALLVSNLMKLSEAEYFREAKEMEKISNKSKDFSSELKEQAQKVEFHFSKVNDYREELENLLPYLGESLKLRRDWMLKGVDNPEVFQLCR